MDRTIGMAIVKDWGQGERKKRNGKMNRERRLMGRREREKRELQEIDRLGNAVRVDLGVYLYYFGVLEGKYSCRNPGPSSRCQRNKVQKQKIGTELSSACPRAVRS